MKPSLSFRLQAFVNLVVALAAFGLPLASCDLNGLLKQGSTKKTAILYGIALYDGPASTPGQGNNLTYPPDDVASMQSLLQSQGWTVISRIDTAATKVQLGLDIQTVANSLEAGQRVLFYYSGHGTGSDFAQPGELVPYQTPSGGVSDQSQFISPTQLSAMFQPITDGGGNLILLLDSCYSGEYVSTGTYTTDLPPAYGNNPFTTGVPGTISAFTQSISDYFNNAYNNGANNKPNVWVLSGAGLENSYDAEQYQHGAFTASFLAAMNKTNGKFNADYNGDGYVTLSELYRYTTQWLNENWNNGYPEVENSDGTYSPALFLPHLSGNPLDILMFKQ